MGGTKKFKPLVVVMSQLWNSFIFIWRPKCSLDIALSLRRRFYGSSASHIKQLRSPNLPLPHKFLHFEVHHCVPVRNFRCSLVTMDNSTTNDVNNPRNYTTRVGLKLESLSSDSFHPKSLNDVDNVAEFFKNIDAVMFDCDGVLWLGMRILPNAPQLVKKLRTLQKKVFFVTNNSTKSREEFLVKFNSLGFEATLDEIISTSFLAALHLKEKNFKEKVYVIGTTGVTKELQAVNIQALPIGADVVPQDMATWSYDFVENQKLDSEVGAVIVGFDHHFSFAKLCKAASYLNDSSCLFIATNTDENFPSAGKMIIPGTGSIVTSVKTAARREPTVMGKPSRVPFDYVQRFHNLDASRVLMVGDRGNTDILFGTICGLRTLLVFTGVTSKEELRHWIMSGNEEEKKCIPEYILEDVAEFYELIKDL